MRGFNIMLALLVVALASSLAMLVVLHAKYVAMRNELNLLRGSLTEKERIIKQLESNVTLLEKKARRLTHKLWLCNTTLHNVREYCNDIESQLTEAEAEREYLEKRVRLFEKATGKSIIDNGFCVLSSTSTCFARIVDKSLEYLQKEHELVESVARYNDPTLRILAAMLQVSGRIVYARDPRLGVVDDWGFYLSIGDMWKSIDRLFLDGWGDCEDISLAVGALLYASGFRNVYLVAFSDRREAGHAFLIVVVNNTIHVVDTLYVDYKYSIVLGVDVAEFNTSRVRRVYIPLLDINKDDMAILLNANYARILVLDVEKYTELCYLRSLRDDLSKCKVMDVGPVLSDWSLREAIMDSIVLYGFEPKDVKRFVVCSFDRRSCRAASSVDHVVKIIIDDIAGKGS